MTPEEKAEQVIALISQNKEFFVEFLKNKTIFAELARKDREEAIRFGERPVVRDEHYIQQWYQHQSTSGTVKAQHREITKNIFRIIGNVDFIYAYSIDQVRDIHGQSKNIRGYGKHDKRMVDIIKDRPYDHKAAPKITMFQNLMNKCIRGVLSPEKSQKRERQFQPFRRDIRVHDYVWRQTYSDGLKNFLINNVELSDYLLESSTQKKIEEMSSSFTEWWRKNKRRKKPKSQMGKHNFQVNELPIQNEARSRLFISQPRKKFGPLSAISETDEHDYSQETGLLNYFYKARDIAEDFVNIRAKYQSKRQWYKKIFPNKRYGSKRAMQVEKLEAHLSQFVSIPDKDNLESLINTIIETKNSIAKENKRKFTSSLDVVLDELVKKIVDATPREVLVEMGYDIKQSSIEKRMEL